jgi:site-specific recombinase XerC
VGNVSKNNVYQLASGQTYNSVAATVASSGVSIAIIKEVLGHTDIRTTQKYSHVDVLSQSQVFAAQYVNNESAVKKKGYKI